MKYLLKKSIAIGLITTLSCSIFVACGQGIKNGNNTDVESASSTIVPEELGSGDIQWSEEKTQDGYIVIKNNNGKTLGYSEKSGKVIIQVDGYAFKDLNSNGELDVYEDWRQDDKSRAADLASKLPIETIFGLMNHHSIGSLLDDGSDASSFYGKSFKESMDEGVRTALSFATSFPAVTKAKWNNSAQVYAESLDFGIPVNISSNPIELSGWAGNLALAATFNPEYIKEVFIEQSKQYRGIGVSTLLGPQIDVASEPRWNRVEGTFGEDPALARDLTNSSISGLQSTYDENGTDLGWGTDSVIAMMKHWTGEGAAEGGREAHNESGKYNVFPNNAFQTHLIPFVDGGLSLDSITKKAASVMTSYSISYSNGGTLGELVGSGFSAYKLDLLRETYGFDELVCSDWGITSDLGEYMATPWGVEDLTKAERTYLALLAGVDQIGGDETPEFAAAYEMLKEELGEEVAEERIRNSGRRIVLTYFQSGLFENPYVDVAQADILINSEETKERAEESQLQSIVMLKNNEAIKKLDNEEKVKAYIPMQFKNGSWVLPIEQKAAEKYYEIVTDTILEPSGEVDESGNVSYSVNDIQRATKSELSGCSFAIVIVNSPKDTYEGYNSETSTYLPISLQYNDYTANLESVREESISGNVVKSEVEGVYGMTQEISKENRSYYGESTTTTNKSDLEGILYATENMPETAKIIVAVNATNAFVVSEFEESVDAILLGFGINNNNFLKIASGEYEANGLLPIQMPKDMEAIEAQSEDMPRDMECYLDQSNNLYDFGFGLNWSGKIQDERTEKYCTDVILTPTNFGN